MQYVTGLTVTEVFSRAGMQQVSVGARQGLGTHSVSIPSLPTRHSPAPHFARATRELKPQNPKHGSVNLPWDQGW